MKTNRAHHAILTVVVLTALAATSAFADKWKAGNTNVLHLTSSWTNNAVPDGTEFGVWSSIVTGAMTNSLGTNMTWGGIKILDPGGPITIAADGNTLTLNGVSGIGIDMSSATQDLTVNCGLTLAASQSFIDPTNRMLTMGGVVSGSGSLTKSGFGTLTLSGNNTFAGGVTISQGSLWIKNSNALGAGSKTVNCSYGTLGHSQIHLDGTGGNLTLPSTINYLVSNWADPGTVYNEGGNNVINGNFTVTSGGGGLIFLANAGSLTLNGTITPDSSGRGVVFDGAGNSTVNGVIADGANYNFLFIQQGVGTTTLTAANTYKGTTDIRAGTLLVNGSLASASVVTVWTNATLGGNGTIGGPVTVQAGATLAPGIGIGWIGRMAINNTLSLAGTTAMDLNKTAATNDQVHGITTLTYGGMLAVTNLAGTLAAGDSFKLFDAAHYTGSFAAISPTTPGIGITWDGSSLPVDGTLRIAGTGPPVITQQPHSLTVTQGQTAIFTILAAGMEPLSYQWQFNGTNILGSTSNVLMIASADFTNAGNYLVVVTNTLGAVTSQVAVLTVEPWTTVVDAQNPGWVRGQVVLQFIAPVAQPLLQALATNTPFAQLPFPADIKNLNQQCSAHGLTQAHPAVGTNNYGLEYIFLLEVNPQADIRQVASAYALSPEVAFAEPDYIAQIVFAPNDVKYPQQWALTKVGASTAWDSAKGDGIVVAVIDTGVDTTHCDLAANCVDGWDFINGSGTVTDPNGHGTHVAGIIAAVGNNTEGVIGLAYEAKIMPLRVLGTDGSGTFNDGANGILWAVRHGAKVINCSWGASVPGGVANVEAAINYAHDNYVLVVCAAGNNHGLPTRDFAPANAENAMAISATDPSDGLAGYSNFGVKTDVAAPGGISNTDPTQGILSTTPLTSYLHNTEGCPTFPDGGTGPCANELDMAISGTSMAAPHVTALAALIWPLHPTWLPEEVKQTIRQSAFPLGLDPANGFDTHFGYGRIDAAAAVADNTQLPIASVTQPRNGAVVQSPQNVIGEAGGVNFTSYSVQIAPGVDPAPSTFVTIGTGPTPVSGVLYPNLQGFANGTYTLRVVTFSSTGLTSEDRNEVQFTSGYITSPGRGSPCPLCLTGGSIPIVGVVPSTMNHLVNGSVVAENLDNYTLSWQPSGGTANLITPVNPGPFNTAGLLANWDLTPVTEGEIVVLLTITYSGGLQVQDSVTVTVDKLLKPGWPVSVNSRPSMKSPMAADLDGNGVKSIIYGASVFNLDGTLRFGWDDNPGLGRSNPAIVDVNNDGKLEIIAAVFSSYFAPGNNDPNDGGVMIYCYPPSGKASPLWSYEVHNPTTAGRFGVPSSISVGDVDGDGQLEAVFTVCFYGDNNETWLFVLDASSGSLKHSKLIPGISWSSVALANLDAAKDPALEMVVSSSINSSGQTTVLKVVNGVLVNLPDSHWPQAVGSPDIDPVVADVDHDGNYEILVANYLWHADGTSFSANWPFPDLSRSTGAFAPPLPHGSNVVCDLDLILGAGNYLVWWRLDDNGNVLSWPLTTGENNLMLWIGENGAQGNPIVADITGDGLAEIIRPPELGFSTQPISKLYASASSQFPRIVCNPDMTIYSTAFVDDVDGDGQTDVLIAAAGKIYFWKLSQTHFLNPESHLWPMFQHDLAHTGTLPINGDGAYDLFVEDTPCMDWVTGGPYTGLPDTGLEPDPNMTHPWQPWWLSRGIWVHNDCSAPPGDYTSHQDPIYGQANCVFVRVCNRGCQTMSGATVQVYAAEWSPALKWPDDWTLIGQATIPDLASRNCYIARVSWSPPGIGHYCLVAVITASNDPLNFPSSDSGTLVLNNNNVAQRNTAVLGKKGKGLSESADIGFRNVATNTKAITLKFTVDRNFLTTGGHAMVDLRDLADRWRTNGGHGLNVTNRVGTSVALLDSPATIEGILMNPDESHQLGLSLTADVPMPVPGWDQVYDFDILQIVDGNVIGGIASVLYTLGHDTNGTISASVIGGGTTLHLCWPADHMGWDLQVQTNSLAIGLNTNWFTVPGSNSTNQMVLPISHSGGAVFYRLRFP